MVLKRACKVHSTDGVVAGIVVMLTHHLNQERWLTTFSVRHVGLLLDVTPSHNSTTREVSMFLPEECIRTMNECVELV